MRLLPALLLVACAPSPVAPEGCSCTDVAVGEEVPATTPDFVTNVELTAPDEREILGYRVAVYERADPSLAPRAEDRGEGFDAGLLLGARVVREEGRAIAVSSGSEQPLHVPSTTTPLTGWVFDPDGRWLATVELDEAHSWPAGHVVVVVARDEARRRSVGPGWTIAVEP